MNTADESAGERTSRIFEPATFLIYVAIVLRTYPDAEKARKVGIVEPVSLMNTCITM